MKRHPLRHVLVLGILALVPALLSWPLAEGFPPGTFLAQAGRDALFTARHLLGRDPALSPRIVLVAVDPLTVRAPHLRKPLALWNREIALVVQALGRAQAEVVALDLLQPYPGLEPQGDMDLARALRQAPTVMAVDVDESSGTLAPPQPMLFYAAGDPGEAGGLIRTSRDADGALRRASFAHQVRAADGGPMTLLTLWFQGTRRLLGWSLAQVQAAWQARSHELPLPQRPVPLVSGGRAQPPEFMLINYAGPAGTVPSVSFLEVLRRRHETGWLRRNFQGRLVFLGVTLPDQLDYHRTPMVWVQRLSQSGSAVRTAVQVSEEMAGTEILAQAANTLVTGRFLALAGPGVSWAWGVVACLAAALAGQARSLRLPLLLAVLAAILGVSVGVFVAFDLILPLVWPVLGSPLAFAGGIGWRHLTTDAERARIRGLLGRYVSDRVAELVVDHPEQVALGGQSAEVTLLFSDLNNFTTWSEKTDPAEVVQTMNEYFTAMEEIIFREGGTLKQFVGDEIMVIFGAPFPQADAEARAVRTALAMQQELVRLGGAWAARGVPRLQAKIGIHRGRVVVGNVGSPRRTEYAAVGDTVNLASRVMGLTKELGHLVLITDEVYQRVADQVEVRTFPPHRVKGRQGLVQVHGLEGLKAPGPASPPSAAG